MSQKILRISATIQDEREFAKRQRFGEGIQKSASTIGLGVPMGNLGGHK